MDTYFPDVIGQTEAKRKLSFYIDGYKKTSVLPNLFLTGSRGYGKTMIAKKIAQHLNIQGNPNQHKTFVEITGAQFQSNKALSTFIDTVITQYVHGFQETTLFFDEIHLAHSSVRDWLLHVINPTESNFTENTYGQVKYQFDFRKFTFMAASTNPEKLSLAFKSRLERVDLHPYKLDELVKLINRYTPNIMFMDGVEYEIAKTMRGVPREVVQFCKRKLPNYLSQKNSEVFGAEDWASLKHTLSIKPLGLLNNEVEALRFLQTRGAGNGATLTEMAAYLGLDSATVRRDCESFLLSHNLIRIDGKRFITQPGQEILEAC